jgi:hypothetical protein
MKDTQEMKGIENVSIQNVSRQNVGRQNVKNDERISSDSSDSSKEFPLNSFLAIDESKKIKRKGRLSRSQNKFKSSQKTTISRDFFEFEFVETEFSQRVQRRERERGRERERENERERERGREREREVEKESRIEKKRERERERERILNDESTEVAEMSTAMTSLMRF